MKKKILRFFHFCKFEPRGVNHFAYKNDLVTRVLKVCRCGEYETCLVPGVWQLEDVTPRDLNFDKQFLKCARIAEVA